MSYFLGEGFGDRIVKPSSFFIDPMATRTKLLQEIFGDLPDGMFFSPVPNVSVSGIAIDSRLVQPGDLFIALRGATSDGHDFIPDALRRGAVAVAGERPMEMDAPYVKLRDARKAVSWIAAGLYGSPARKLTVVGVTGTDGKTTTANLIHRILTEAGIKAGIISTVNAVIGDRQLETGLHVTTPDAHDVQRYLSEMVEANLTHVVLETTSHGLAQHRVDACEFDIGVVTNITHEHLDEHGSYENYRLAKARLLRSLAQTKAKPQGNPRLAVLNRDDQSFDYLQRQAPVRHISYGMSRQADVRATEVIEKREGVGFVADADGFRVAISSHLPGSYNVSNCLAAICATVVGLDVAPETAARGIEAFPGIPGRMERIGMGQDFLAIVDFAHTPNALKAALQTGRLLLGGSMPAGRLIVVFGSAGLRDREKRRMMAEIAADLADLSVLTAEDPRTESLNEILADMATGASARGGHEGETFWRVADRGDAIRFALAHARAGDVLIVCGKGHEQSMCFGSVEYPWDDRTAMRAALAEHLHVPGPTMPYLPTRDQREEDWLHSRSISH